MQDFRYLEAAHANLSTALGILDKIGFTLSAAHVETAIQSLYADPIIERPRQSLYRIDYGDFSALDEFIDHMFASRHETSFACTESRTVVICLGAPAGNLSWVNQIHRVP
jgi:hypothetical protein